MKNIFLVMPLLALMAVYSTPASAEDSSVGEALGEGCLGLAIPTAALVAGVGAYHYKDVIADPRGTANVALLSVGGACAMGAAVGGYAVGVAGAAELPSEKDLQAEESPASDQSE